MIKISGLDGISERLKQYDFEQKKRTFMQRLADIGVDVATTEFANALYAGNNDVVVDKPQWVNDNTIVISAHGKSVTFIEFGSGVHYSEQHPKASELGFERGEYGYKLGRNDTWRYKGEAGNLGEPITSGKHTGEILTHGNPPAMAMYKAAKEMREKILDIAQEVFR